jgi:hypothetical protein
MFIQLKIKWLQDINYILTIGWKDIVRGCPNHLKWELDRNNGIYLQNWVDFLS